MFADQNNGSTNSNSTKSQIHSGSAIFIGLLSIDQAKLWVSMFIVEAVLIISANCLSILVFTGKKYRRKKSSLLLANLALSDLLVGCLATSFQVYVLGAPWFWDYNLPMALNVPIDMFTGFCSLFSLTAIALERMFATWYPIQYKFAKTYAYLIVIAITWLLSVLVPCAVYLVPRGILSQSDNRYLISVLLCLSVLLIIFSYTAIGFKMSCQNANQNQRQKRQSHVIKTLSLVTFLSLISWLPFQVIILVFYFSKSKPNIPYIVIISTKFLQFGNSFVNSIVYYLRLPGFRSDLRRIVCSRLPRMLSCQSGDPRNQERNENSGHNENPDVEDRGHSTYTTSPSCITTNTSTFSEETKL